MVHVDSDGSASGGTKEKEQKNMLKGIKKVEGEGGQKMKEDGEKNGVKNAGYETDDTDKVHNQASHAVSS